MASIDELLSAAKAKRETAPESDVVEVLLGGELVAFKFTEMPGDEWSELTVHNPPREDVPVDQVRGYDVYAVTRRAAAVNGVLVDGDSESPVSADQWEQIWPLLSAPDFQDICGSVWKLNEWAPRERFEDAKKASRVAPDSKKK